MNNHFILIFCGMPSLTDRPTIRSIHVVLVMQHTIHANYSPAIACLNRSCSVHGLISRPRDPFGKTMDAIVPEGQICQESDVQTTINTKK